MPRRKKDRTPAEPALKRRGSPGVVLPILLVLVTVAAYSNSFRGVYLLDDDRALVNNARIRSQSPLRILMNSRRPVAELSFAANFGPDGPNLKALHFGNLAVHVLAGLALFGLVRRTCRLAHMPDSWRGGADAVAFGAALLWSVHPLLTQSVTYLIQRCEALMGLFYLLTLYCLVRCAGSGRKRAWTVAAIACAVLGMGSKAVMVTVPLTALLYDRVFLSASWGEVFRRRGLLHAGIAASLLMLLATDVAQGIFLSDRPGTRTVGFGVEQVSPAAYAATQTQVLLRYFSLALWPAGLCLDYAWPFAGGLGDVVVPAILVGGLVLVSLVLLLVRPRVGFLAVAFFIVLAPTSSVVPIRDAIFEHRMYLPLAALACLFTLGLYALTRRIGRPPTGQRVFVTTLAVAALALGSATYARNRMYHDKLTMWKDVVDKRPYNLRGWNQYAAGLFAAGRLDDAITVAERTAQSFPDDAESRSNLCAWLYQFRADRTADAVRYGEEAVRAKPDFAQAHFNLALALFRVGRQEDAVRALQTAADLKPRSAEIHRTLGEALERVGRREEAIAAYRNALRADPASAAARDALRRLGA